MHYIDLHIYIGVCIPKKIPPKKIQSQESKNSNPEKGNDALHSHLLVLLLASPTAAFSSRSNSLLRSIPWLKSSNFLLFPQISHVSGVIYLLTHAPANITTQKEIIKYPGRLDFAITS